MKRPTAVTVFGVLNIVFAVLGGLGSVGSLMLFLPQAENLHSPVIQIIHDHPAYAVWMKISIGLGLLVSVALLAAGIGLLRLKPWARTLSIAYSIYALVMILIGIAMNFVFLVQPLLEQAKEKHGPESAAALGGAIGGTFGGCFGLIYPVLLMIFMRRANIIAAFHPELANTIPPGNQQTK